MTLGNYVPGSDKYKIAEEEIKEVEVVILEKAIFVPLTSTVTLCRDPEDDAVLETTILAKANYLVTRDKDVKTSDLIAHLKKHGVEIIAVSEYVEQLSNK